MNSTTPLTSKMPPLAGLCSYEEASRTAMSVEDCVEWLKRLHYVWKRLHEIFTSHITAEPIYELKTAFSWHAHLCAEHAQAIRTRVSGCQASSAVIKKRTAKGSVNTKPRIATAPMNQNSDM